jgi:steroid 5-alpha reductase family enzyme
MVLFFSGIFLVQWLGFAVAWTLKTERYYDLTGSLTYLVVVILAWRLGQPASWGANLLFVAVVVWATRLGSFLFLRVIEVGEDQRFRHIKESAPRFLMAWTLQGTWVAITVSAVLVALLPAHGAPAGPHGVFSTSVFALGYIVAIAGLALEITADQQKTRFRKNPENKGRFIHTGLWSRSRHPNYFGEILFWLGLAVAATPSMSGMQYAAWLSPLFVYFLLTRLSGIPTLARRGQKLWGDDPAYQAYLATTPRLLPRLTKPNSTNP